MSRLNGEMFAIETALDTIDRRILRELQADGRITNLKLAEAVHLSPTAVLERVNASRATRSSSAMKPG